MAEKNENKRGKSHQKKDIFSNNKHFKFLPFEISTYLLMRNQKQQQQQQQQQREQHHQQQQQQKV